MWKTERDKKYVKRTNFVEAKENLQFKRGLFSFRGDPDPSKGFVFSLAHKIQSSIQWHPHKDPGSLQSSNSDPVPA